MIGASISLDSCRIAFTAHPSLELAYLYIYNGSTGEQLACRVTQEGRPWFAPDGCDLWIANDSGEGWAFRVSGERQIPGVRMRRVDIEHPPEGYPWASSRGYRITNDWWILGSDGKRLLMLPPSWQPPKAVLRVWKGKFLALLHCGLSKPVILEVEP